MFSEAEQWRTGGCVRVSTENLGRRQAARKVPWMMQNSKFLVER